MKNILLIFTLCFFSVQGYAFTCLNLITGDTFSSNQNQDVMVPVQNELVQDENIFANVGEYFACRNDYGWGQDFMDLTAVDMGPKLATGGVKGGVYINGQRYYDDDPALAVGVNIYTLTAKEWTPMDVDMFFDVSSTPGSLIVINQGDVLMRLTLFFRSGIDGVTRTYIWTFRAANDAFLATGSCSINDDEVIEVDFGDISDADIGYPGTMSPTQRHKQIELNYRCDDPRLNLDIQIMLNAGISAFTTNGIEVKGVSGLAVEMYHEGNIIPPFSSFRSRIENGTGHDSVVFNVVRTPDPQMGDLQYGEFEANATLVMSTP